MWWGEGKVKNRNERARRVRRTNPHGLTKNCTVKTVWSRINRGFGDKPAKTPENEINLPAF
jgi:hypothetical protein